MRRTTVTIAAFVRFTLAVLALSLAACASSVCPTIDAHRPEDAAQSLEDSAPSHEDAPPERVELDATTEDAPPDVIDRDAWGCSPCAALRRCCMAEWGPACEIIDRNFSLDWCEGRYGRFVQCGTCDPLDCATVRAVACLPRD